MNFNYCGMVDENNPLNIAKTSDMTANKILALFLKINSPIYDLLENSPSVKALNEMVDIWNSEGRDFDISFSAIDCSGSIIDCFLEFLANCPNIHITID